MKGTQIITALLIMINLLIGAYLHGKERKGKHNFWITLLGCTIWVLLLIGCGFFDL
jgi:hypothetical protein